MTGIVSVYLLVQCVLSLKLRVHMTSEHVSKWNTDATAASTWNEEASLVSDFVKWRHGDVYLSATEEDAALSEKIRAPNQDQLAKCSKTVITPMPRNLSHYFFTDWRVEQFLHNVDHIYVLCVKCQRSLPQSLVGRTSNIHATISDKCLGMQGGRGHYAKATASHRLAVTHAQEKAYKSILILEEDASFDLKDTSHFDFSSISQLIGDEARTWDVIRIGWKNRNNEWAKKSCHQTCKCSMWVQQNMCTIESRACHLLSTSGYIMSGKVFQRFLDVGQPSAIDVYINQFKNTIVTPPLIHQPGYNNEKIGDQPFAQKCKQKA